MKLYIDLNNTKMRSSKLKKIIIYYINIILIKLFRKIIIIFNYFLTL